MVTVRTPNDEDEEEPTTEVIEQNVDTVEESEEE